MVGTGWVGFRLGKRTHHTVSKTEVTRNMRGAEAGRFASYGLELGPWGNLQCQQIVLQIPEECLAVLPPAGKAPPTWWFKGYSSAALEELLQRAGLSEAEKRDLLNTDHWSKSPGGILLRPSATTILSLSMEARSVLYSALAPSRENISQYAPFFWQTADEKSFFSGAMISEKAKSLIQRLSYRKGNLSLFADLGTLLEQFPDRTERIKIQKLLSSQPAVLVKLDITPESDIDGLIRYWGVGGLAKMEEPVLESAAKIPGGRSISLFAMLPAFARERLNTYPNANAGNLTDSLWSAFNFFKDQPDAPPANGSFWNEQLKENYFPVFSDPRYGDILIVSRPDGSVVRAAVFLAGDLVFTRNGTSAWDPWIITTVPQMLEVCSIRLADQETPSVSYYRNKNFD